MKRLAAFAFSALSLACLSLPASCRSPIYPTKPFQATWESKGPSGTYTTRFSTDGQGRGRTDAVNARGTASTGIADLKTMSMYLLMDESRLAMKFPLKPEDIPVFADLANKNKGKEIGVKVIDGHPCHGKLYDMGGTISEVWTGDDIQVAVYSVVTMPGRGKTVRRLTHYLPTSPGPQAFVVPAAYKIVGAGAAFN